MAPRTRRIGLVVALAALGTPSAATEAPGEPLKNSESDLARLCLCTQAFMECLPTETQATYGFEKDFCNINDATKFQLESYFYSEQSYTSEGAIEVACEAAAITLPSDGSVAINREHATMASGNVWFKKIVVIEEMEHVRQGTASQIDAEWRRLEQEITNVVAREAMRRATFNYREVAAKVVVAEWLGSVDVPAAEQDAYADALAEFCKSLKNSIEALCNNIEVLAAHGVVSDVTPAGRFRKLLDKCKDEAQEVHDALC